MGSEKLEQLRASAFGARTSLSEKLLGVAIRTQNFVGSTGVAIALKEGGEMVCRANWGTSAPEVGAKLSIEDSFTGICVRTGDAVRCDDTQTDPRVDKDACQALGILAIAAAPVRRGLKLIGVIAAFSDTPRAFTDKHLLILSTLSETIAEVLDEGEPVQPLAQQPKTAAEVVRRATFPQLPVTVAADTPAATVTREAAGSSAKANLAGPFAATAPVQSEARVATGRLPISPEVSSASSRCTPGERGSAAFEFVVPAPAPASDSGTAWTLTFGALKINSNTPRWLPLAALLAMFAVIAIAGWRTRKSGETMQVPAVSSPELMQAPQPAQAQGMVPAQLIRRVEPLYPEEARRLNISGSVTVKATITNSGTVSNVLWVKGNDVFRHSAVTAVRQWRYEPAILNGQPVESEVEIVLLFALV